MNHTSSQKLKIFVTLSCKSVVPILTTRALNGPVLETWPSGVSHAYTTHSFFILAENNHSSLLLFPRCHLGLDFRTFFWLAKEARLSMAHSCSRRRESLHVSSIRVARDLEIEAGELGEPKWMDISSHGVGRRSLCSTLLRLSKAA